MVEKLNGLPEAEVRLRGNEKYSEVHGIISMFDVYGGSVVMAELYGLPDEMQDGREPAFGLFMDNRFLFLLLPVNGAAWCAMYTGRFHPDDVYGKAVTVRRMGKGMSARTEDDITGEEIVGGNIGEMMRDTDEDDAAYN